jgi:hypothetical protein
MGWTGRVKRKSGPLATYIKLIKRRNYQIAYPNCRFLGNKFRKKLTSPISAISFLSIFKAYHGKSSSEKSS